jgi:adenylate cyclase
MGRRSVASLIAAAAMFICLVLARNLGALQYLELMAFDLGMAKGGRLPSASTRITLVGVTESDIQRLGHWPLTDEQLAMAITTLQSFRPRVIGIDIYRDVPVEPGSRRLDEVLATTPSVIVVMKVADSDTPAVLSPRILRDTPRACFNDVVEDREGIARRTLLFMDAGQTVAQSFALCLALNYLAPDGIAPVPDPQHPDYMRLGGTTLPPIDGNFGAYVRADAAGYQLMLNHARSPDRFDEYSLAELESGKIPADKLRGRIVIFGITAASVKDYFVTPANRWRSGASSRISGIALHALAADQLLRTALEHERPLGSLNSWQEYLWIALFCLAGAWCAAWTQTTLLAFAAASIGGVLIVVASTALALKSGLWLPSVPPLLGWLGSLALVVGYRAQREHAERDAVMGLFARHVSPEIAATIWENRARLLRDGRLVPQTLTLTVLFVDIAKSTTIVEQLEPDAALEWLNTAMNRLSEIIMAHGGVIDDYFGDGIKANFGAPLAATSPQQIADCARRAVDCGLNMGREMATLNARWQAAGFPPTAIRIGIATGRAVAGSVGSSQRLKYTTVGDAVNTAARLESWAGTAGGAEGVAADFRLLISETTREQLDDSYCLEFMGAAMLKGKERPINVYRVVAAPPITTAMSQPEVAP